MAYNVETAKSLIRMLRDEKIAQSTGGADEPCIADEGQVMAMLLPMLFKPRIGGHQ